MSMAIEPASYDAWYHTPNGQWIGKQEISLLMELMQPKKGTMLLDVGCGTGYFSRKFSDEGLVVSGIEPDPMMINYARKQTDEINYIEGIVEKLPFEDNSFDYCAAVTSLCFVSEPEKALAEMWRVSRNGIVLGLLNRDSVLYQNKHGKGGYIGARWDIWLEVQDWTVSLKPSPSEIKKKTAVFLPSGSIFARLIESLLPGSLLLGGFLAVYLKKPI